MKNNDIEESTVTKRDSQNFTGLSIDQMRAIVEGAQPWAAFYVISGEYAGHYGNAEGVCVEGCFTDSLDVSGVSVSLKDLRAAIAEHDASINPQDAATATVAEVPGQKREINKKIAAYLGYICDDKWEFNQNAMRDGSDSRAFANLSLKIPGQEGFAVIGWNPFESSADAFSLLTKMDLSLPLNGLSESEARQKVVFAAMEFLKDNGHD